MLAVKTVDEPCGRPHAPEVAAGRLWRSVGNAGRTLAPPSTLQDSWRVKPANGRAGSESDVAVL